MASCINCRPNSIISSALSKSNVPYWFMGISAKMSVLTNLFINTVLFCIIISVIRGLYLLIFGLYCMYHAFVFARRSGKKGWWVLVILSAIMIFLGVISFIEPGSTFEAEFRNTGWVVLFSSVVSGLRRVWLYAPRKKAKKEAALYENE